MVEINLRAEKRTATGKEQIKRLRKSGLIPAVVYGRHTESFNVQVNDREFSQLAHGEHGASLESILISLKIEGEKSGKRMTLIKEIQQNPFTGKVTHIDFNEVSLTEKITAYIPIIVIGTSKGEKEGGIVDQTLREVEITCLPTELPEEIKIDVTNLGLHDSIHVRDLDLSDKVEILNDEELSIVSIIVPRIVEEPVEEVVEEEGVEEPEVIGKKPEEEEQQQEGKGEK